MIQQNSQAARRILWLEDDPHDRDIVASALAREGLACTFTFARGQSDFEAALQQGTFDLVLADYTLPGYGGAEALSAVQLFQPELPLIFLSGQVDEARVVQSLKAGAADYVSKDRLQRLGPAIERALREAAERRARRRAEAALRKMQMLKEVLLSNIPFGIDIIDREGRVLFMNQVLQNLAKASAGRWCWEIYKDDRQQCCDCLMRRPPQMGQNCVREQHFVLGGKIFQVNYVGVEYEGKPGALRLFQDITERKQLEALVRQSQKMEAIGHLAGGVAHDFNNLLTVIRGSADLALLQPVQLNQTQRDCLNQVNAAVERAANLTRQLLAFSRKQVIKSQSVDLNELVANLLRMLRRIIGEQVHLLCDYAAATPWVQADPGLLEQVLMNLVVNARDAMPQGGRLSITTSRLLVDADHPQAHPEARPGEFVCLSVADTGTGIAPEHLPHLFEPFFTTKAAGKGTGLGLAVVYGIVKQHQGWIEVASQPGKGAAFKVFLPALATPLTPKSAPADASGERGGTETILLVEDDSAVRLLTQRVLETFGYQVSPAASGPQALEAWRPRLAEIDLLLTDVIMPDGMTGLELAEQLRRQRPGLKVILTSGYSADALSKHAHWPPANKSHFLPKPCSPRALLRTIRQCLDETQPASEAGTAGSHERQ